jgi:hypothetical protein
VIPEAFMARLRGIQANPATVYIEPEPAPPPPPPVPPVPVIRTWVPARERPDPDLPERPPEVGWMVELDEWARARRAPP